MFDSGTVYICDKENIAPNGSMPREALVPVRKFWFENRSIGINRSFLAKGVNESVDRVIRVQGHQNISTHQFAILGNGEQFRITMVSQGHDENEYTRMVQQKYYKTARIVGLNYTELTLMRVDENYEQQIV